MVSQAQIEANRRNAGTSTGPRSGASRAFPPRGGQPMFGAEHIPEVEALASPRRAPDRETACGNPHMRHSAVDGKPGPGRPAGRPNKITGQAKENIAEVFEILGGVEGMVKWARNHPTEFYCKIYPKLIGVDVQAETDEALKRDDNSASEALERLFLNILASRQDGYEKDPFVTDHDASGGAAPESAVTRTNGSAAIGERSG